MIPQGRIAERLVRASPEGQLRLQAEPAVRLADLTKEGLDLRTDLVGSHVDMPVIGDEMADARQAGQRPG